jgi:predicted GNAT family acetyltransferase
MTTPLRIRHDAQAQRFEADVEGGTAECAYRLADGVMTLFHTEVPPRAEGHGIAAKLVRAALDHARAEGLKVRPACSYVRTYMRRHSDTHDLLEP